MPTLCFHAYLVLPCRLGPLWAAALCCRCGWALCTLGAGGAHGPGNGGGQEGGAVLPRNPQDVPRPAVFPAAAATEGEGGRLPA